MDITTAGPAGLGIDLGQPSTDADGWTVRDLIARPGLDGPNGVLQGGFAVGVAEAIARQVDPHGAALTSIEARLHAPTPLGRPLQARVRPAEGVARYAVETRDGDRLLVSSVVELAGHEPGPGPADLRELAAAPVPEPEPQYAFPRCFVCGPEPEHELALRLHPQLLSPTSACNPFVVGDPLADEHGNAAPLVLAAVLDCPTVWASYAYVRSIGHQGALLGGFRLTFFADAPIMEPLKVVARMDDTDGRKIRARGAVVDDDGTCYAVSSALHISVAEIPPEPSAPVASGPA